MRNARTRTALAVTTACAAVLVTMPAAHAESSVVNDGADATASLTDIRKVRIDHGADELTVRVNFPDLRKKANAGLNIYVDKNPDRRGPEFTLGTALFSGSDYSLGRAKKWKFAGDAPIECSYDVDLKWKRDVLVFTADRGCFGNPDELRIAMRMVDLADGSHPVRDWMIGRREFSSWLAAGA